MASITTWTRLEPRSRGDDLLPSLEARVYDAAWLLGRQWQLGEFVGEDAGSPVQVQLAVEAAPIVAYRGGNQACAVSAATPFDCLAGAEPRGTSSLAERAEGGAELLQLLEEAGCTVEGVASLVGASLLPAAAAGRTTSDGAALLLLATGRLPDGDALAPKLQAIATSGQVTNGVGLSAADQNAIVTAARAWIAWRASRANAAPSSSWVDEQLEHHFALTVQPSGGAPVALSAPSWDGDRLDWYDIDVDRRILPPARPAGTPAAAPLPGVVPATGVLIADGIPAPLTYPGMPSSRWWQFEDAHINFAHITAAPEDLARMLVVEFASVYGNDWYLWPLELPVGALHRITKLEVVNTFGDKVTVSPVPASAGGSTTVDWQLFRPTEQRQTGPPAAYEGLLLLPSLASPLESEVFEEVRYFRDELANLAWAVEATVRGEDGLPLDRHSAAAVIGGIPAATAERQGSDTQPLRYRFETDVPIYWFPLAPDAGGAPTFHRLVLRRVDEAGDEHDVLPEGELLLPKGLWLWQEEVPREGARVFRRHRMARGSDGALYVWSARRAETGRGEGSSGLRYDDTLPVPEVPVP